MGSERFGDARDFGRHCLGREIRGSFPVVLKVDGRSVLVFSPQDGCHGRDLWT